ncbi:MAG: hypothetical protein ABSD85_03010 [Acidimicrobiales bacterium]
MPNRLDIELTSARGDGSYTWRAAGARQPKGVIDGKLLSDGAKVGDVLRVEAEVEIDGITILSVLPPKEKATPSGRIELLGSSKPVAAVTTVLVSEGGRGRSDRRDLLDSPRRGERAGGRDRRPSRGAERPDARRPQPGEGGSDVTGDRRPERRPRVEATPAGGTPGTSVRPARPSGERRPERRPRVESTPGGDSQAGTGPGDQRRPRAAASAGSGAPTGQRDRRPDARQPSAFRPGPQGAPRRTPPRFEPGTVHREELLTGLASEQRPIAERLAAGGIPAIRRAIAEERERARSEGRPEVSGDAILALAEQLAPSVKQAIWLDRAEAAVAEIEQISLRDLRTTVAAAAPRDEAARDLDRKLREELDRRVKKLRTHWEEQMTHALEEGRVLQALRFSAQPPEPTARFPAALVERLASSAGAAMTSATPVERWLALLDAAAASPIRRQIHPEGLPEDASGEVVRKARLAAGSIPALAPMIGLSMPPPPKPIRGARPLRPPRPPARPARRSGPAAGRKDSPPAKTTVESAAAETTPQATADTEDAAPVETARVESHPTAGLEAEIVADGAQGAEPETHAENEAPQADAGDTPADVVAAESEPAEPEVAAQLEGASEHAPEVVAEPAHSAEAGTHAEGATTQGDAGDTPPEVQS